MNKLQTQLWDAANHVEVKEDIAAYLEVALADGDPALIAAALGDIARSKRMTQISRDTVFGRDSLYQALSIEGNPKFTTIPKVVWALGLRLQVTPLESESFI